MRKGLRPVATIILLIRLHVLLQHSVYTFYKFSVYSVCVLYALLYEINCNEHFLYSGTQNQNLLLVCHIFFL